MNGILDLLGKNKKSFACIFCLLFASGCSIGKNFYAETIPVGELQSVSFKSDDYAYGKIVITEITKAEYELNNGLNTIAELRGDNAIRKYCSLSFSYFDINDNEFLINIRDLDYSKGTPSTYHGSIFFEENNELTGSITLIARTEGVNIMTTINQKFTSSYYEK